MPKRVEENVVFGVRLKELCTKQNVSMRVLRDNIVKFCNDNGISRVPGFSTCYTWFRGCVPPEGVLIAISSYFDVSVDYLLGRAADSTQKEKYVDLSELPPECLKNVKAVESTIVMPSGKKMKVINVRDGIALPDSEAHDE